MVVPTNSHNVINHGENIVDPLDPLQMRRLRGGLSNRENGNLPDRPVLIWAAIVLYNYKKSFIFIKY